jgi:hypothetical protein
LDGFGVAAEAHERELDPFIASFTFCERVDQWTFLRPTMKMEFF